jgi:hypothetical protein
LPDRNFRCATPLLRLPWFAARIPEEGLVNLLRATMLFGLLVCAAIASAQQFKDAHEPPPTGWTGPKFVLSQDYPATKPTNQPKPWKSIDFHTNPAGYLNAVLQYCYEGNIEVDWRGQDNNVRKWYHAPWLDADDTKGREFIHGMTRERSARARRLHPNQSAVLGAYAVGMYNPLGGWAIGRVWADHDSPDPSKANFPEGSVAVKLLFIAVPESLDSTLPASQHLDTQVPYLANSFEWDGNLASDGNFQTKTRKPGRVRLIQIDVAVKDSRAATTSGWVFGTFNYNAAAPGTRPWDRMIPVGLMWGSDPTLTPALYRSGSRPQQSKTIQANVMANQATDWHGLGWGERLNGPIDNPASACLSCHMTAQNPTVSPMLMNTLPWGDVKDPSKDLDPDAVTQKMRWFRNIKRQAFDSGSISLDYSLQLQDGLDAWCQATHCNSR